VKISFLKFAGGRDGKPETCFGCGSTNTKKLRLLNNIALQNKLETPYPALVKQALLIEIPPDVKLKIYLKCTRLMEKVNFSLLQPTTMFLF
jgi:hypothetical protein